MKIIKDISLKKYNTFGIDVKAKSFVEIRSVGELIVLLNEYNLNEKPYLILGGGSNLLLTKDFDGLVIKISIKGIQKVKEDSEFVHLNVGAGENWHEFVLFCIENNYAGVENLSLIPGTVGAAPMQNIGAYGVEIKEVLDTVEAIEIISKHSRIFLNNECEFGYRESIFKKELKGKYIITNVVFRLFKTPRFNISYGAISDTLKKMGSPALSIKSISDAVIKIRRSKLPDPEVIGNAGSFFKNPEIPEEKFTSIQSAYPNAPGYPVSNGKVKIPAGWLIEQCGWKGKVIGNTGVHKDQALVLVNYGNATGNEIWNLAQEVQKSVKEKFRIILSPEVNVV